MNPLKEHHGTWSGTSTFRLMPTDDFANGPSSATSVAEADGWGWSLRYTWVHPEDGAQSGLLLIGSPDDDGSVNAAWTDSWHQKPHLALLTGTVADAGVDLETEYAAGWLWRISVRPAEDGLAMQMVNVVPDRGEEGPGGPYVVMDATWSRAQS